MSRFNVSIILEAIDEATRPIRRVSQSLRNLGRNSGINNLKAQLGQVKSAFGNVIHEAGLFATKLTAIGAAAGFAFKKFIFDPMAEFETLEVKLRGLNQGDLKKAQKELAWIKEFAKTTPLELQGVTESFIQMKAMGLDPMDGTMRKLVDTASFLGGTQEEMRRLILAVGQAWAKEKLQGEEVRQMTELGIPVWQLLSKVTGKNTKGLMKLSEAGKLGRKEIQMLINALGTEFRGGAENLAGTTQGIISNLKDAWINFTDILREKGLLDYFKRQLQGLLSFVNNIPEAELKQKAEEIKNTIIAVFEGIREAARQVWPVLKGLVNVMVFLKNAVGGWGNFLMLVIALLGAPLIVAIGKALVSVGALGKTVWGLIGGLAGLKKAFMAIRVAILAISSAGWPVILAVTLIAGLAYLVIRNWSALKDFFRGLWVMIKTGFYQVVNAVQPFIQKAVETLSAWLPVQQIAGVFRTIAGAIGGAVTRAKEFIGVAARAANAVKGFVSARFNAIRQLGAADRSLSGATGKGIAERITGRAHGGFVRRGLPYMVGEFGRELFVPGADGRVIPNNALRKGGGGTGGNLAIHLRIDSEGRPHVVSVNKPSGIDLSLDMGLVNSYA